MPICALTEQAVMVMPDRSLVVTTFSRQSWLLQRMATSVTSMLTFAGDERQSKRTRVVPTLAAHRILADVPASVIEA
jgi:hypothetical protein